MTRDAVALLLDISSPMVSATSGGDKFGREVDKNILSLKYSKPIPQSIKLCPALFPGD